MRSTLAPVVDVSSMHAHKCTEDSQTRIQGGGWLVITFTIYFCRLAAVAAPVINVSLANAQKFNNEGLTRIQEGGPLVITFNLHFCR